LSVTDLFNYVGIKNETARNPLRISGFYGNEKDVYTIDLEQKVIVYKENKFEFETKDVITSGVNFYLSQSVLLRVFSIHSDFNFRSLTVSIKSETEFPKEKDLRLQKLRSMSGMQNHYRADTIIACTRSL